MASGKPKILIEIAYGDWAQKYLRSLPPEHFMEATGQSRQREITLESLDLLHYRKPEVQVFNELLVQYPRPGERKPGRVVPDNMVMIAKQLQSTTGKSQAFLGLGDGERIWLAERQGKIVGCIAIVASAPEVAQLRWFLVDPSARGLGIGRMLIHEAIAFSRACGYKSVILWTVSVLTVAAHLYRSVGFRLVERKPAKQWGVDVIEERYELNLE